MTQINDHQPQYVIFLDIFTTISISSRLPALFGTCCDKFRGHSSQFSSTSWVTLDDPGAQWSTRSDGLPGLVNIHKAIENDHRNGWFTDLITHQTLSNMVISHSHVAVYQRLIVHNHPKKMLWILELHHPSSRRSPESGGRWWGLHDLMIDMLELFVIFVG